MLQHRCVAEARLANATKVDLVVLEILLELSLGVWERGLAIAEIRVPWKAFRWESVVRDVGEPLEVANDRIDREGTGAEGFKRLLDVLAILPSPTGCDETERVQRWHPRWTNQLEVSLRSPVQGVSRHQVELKVALGGPGDGAILEFVTCSQTIILHLPNCPVHCRQSCIAICAEVVRHETLLVLNRRGIHAREEQHPCVILTSPSAVEPSSRARTQLQLHILEFHVYRLRLSDHRLRCIQEREGACRSGDSERAKVGFNLHLVTFQFRGEGCIRLIWTHHRTLESRTSCVLVISIHLV
mmetsp:Transcript_63500/g.151408  ORF Transcript_63500/g.151408 Transcript_63500/m.151408 type:complete len:299 (-) Transcript_63500:263-1159(-)